jgi:hypothetical protein
MKSQYSEYHTRTITDAIKKFREQNPQEEKKTILKNFKCQCKRQNAIQVPKETTDGIYINEQPCTNCGCYMGTIESLQFWPSIEELFQKKSAKS